ncbi:hypothetical protein VTK73DRAFT_6698 [Phialemonium thermophilum]|uniref:alpha-1,2-Mannosidase n=1 Tax=Phialemonium thermophilum TaxID=223376 RepID=A0ABR3WI19_9PEZI
MPLAMAWYSPESDGSRRTRSSKANLRFAKRRACVVDPPWTLAVVLASLFLCVGQVLAMRPERIVQLRLDTVDMFYHGFDNYMKIAFPEDELRPVSCTPLTRDPHNPRNVELNDVLGNYSLTLIDSLSTLAILASAPPDSRGTGPKALRDFQDGVAALVRQYGDGRPGPSGQGARARGFDLDSKVQVFETVIRGVGGLLSAHLFAVGDLPITGYHPRRFGDEPVETHPIVWPNKFKYDGQLLRLALDLAERLLPAFYTTTGMPYPRVNLRHGIPFYVNSPLHEMSGGDVYVDGPPEITETCSAGAGSLVLEFTVLSRLTGDPRFEQLAKRAFWAVWQRKSRIGLIGAGVDAEDGQWIGAYSVIGAGADSFFEYALKSHILLSGAELPNRTYSPPDKRDKWLDPNTLYPPLTDDENSADSFLEAWHHAHAAIKRHLYTDREHPHYINVNLWTGSFASSWIDSLGAYYSGLLTLAGELEEAIETNLLYTAIWTKYAALPERWSLKDKNVEGGLGWWPLRPEFIESTYHLYRATKDPWYLYVGEMVQLDIQRRCWTPCGWAGLQNVLTGEKSDRMESFFLGETAKYMYLLFDSSHPLNSLDAAFVFSTEGHPLVIPRAKRATKGKKVKRKVSRPSKSQELVPYEESGFTTTCPVPPRPQPITVSATAARPDIYHAARLLDLHLLPSTSLVPDSSFFPRTLPGELLPNNGTCAKVYEPVEIMLEFSSSPQQGGTGSVFNFLLAPQNLARLGTDLIRVTSLAGLKMTMRLDEEDNSEWRVTKVNGLPLGRDESVVVDRAVVGDISDTRFNLVRDPVIARLQHLHRVDVPRTAKHGAGGASPEEYAARVLAEDRPVLFDDPADHGNRSNAKFHNEDFRTRVRSLLGRMAASLDVDPPAATNPRTRGAAQLVPPFNLVINQTAVLATGIGAAPLPEAADSSSDARIPDFGPVPDGMLPWRTVFAAGRACSGPLPSDVPRDHQVIVMRRGGCNFSEKLANIPAFAPSPTSLQLVVMVSDEEEEDDVVGVEHEEESRQVDVEGEHDDVENNELRAPAARWRTGWTRPLLDQVQRTPRGIERRYPIPMVMVGGGPVTYYQLAMAERIGLSRRYYVESHGARVRNLIIDNGETRR